jgi:putative transposase
VHGRKKRISAPLDTIREIPEPVWERLKPILDEMYPPRPTGRPRIDLRAALNGAIFRTRSGCQWNHLPRRFGDDSSVHRRFQRRVGDGVFERLWAVLVEECDDLGGVGWEWRAADGCMGKARSGGEKRGGIRRTGANRARRRAS